MKVLITGAKGLLGSQLAAVLTQEGIETVGLDISKSNEQIDLQIVETDLCNYKSAYDTITKLNPDVVIHCAAQANVDECERNPEMAYRFNAIATRNVALACQRFDSDMVYISTDYVFSGDQTFAQGFTEFDTPCPEGVYATTKVEGERIVKDFLLKYYIVRPAWLFGHKRPNFVSQIAQALSENKTTKQVDDMVSSPTNVKDLAVSIAFLIKTGCYGTYHITNTGFDSRYNVACYIATLMGAPSDLIEKCKLKDLGLLSPRPKFSGLNHFVWKLNGFKPLRPWQEAVKEFLEEKGII